MNSWSLDKSSWKLISPEGLSMKLTAKEISFMNILMSQAGKNISRQTLLEALTYPSNEYGNRSMDAMLRRLRKKAEQELHKPLPIQTIHAVGYCFSSPATFLT
jgi:DNA-binding response OmpR family regulator